MGIIPLQGLGLPVPNAPCGVEIKPTHKRPINALFVPNAPCGVEMLMAGMSSFSGEKSVPNAPCGVEISFSTPSFGLS